MSLLNNNFFLIFVKTKKSKIKVSVNLMSGKNLFSDLFMMPSGCVQQTPWSYFVRRLIPFMRVLSSRSNHFAKALPPNTITLRVKISTYEYLGGTNRYSSILFSFGAGRLLFKKHDYLLVLSICIHFKN